MQFSALLNTFDIRFNLSSKHTKNFDAMNLLTQKTKHPFNHETDSGITSPPGWVSTTTKNNKLKAEITTAEDGKQSFANQYLPGAAARAEQLINALNKELGIQVPVSYMRIETGTLFHVLLLIDLEDFHSPKLQAARLLAGKYSNTEDSYDIKFSFGAKPLNPTNTETMFREYNLVHIRNAAHSKEFATS
jgi:hypothetical protein